MHAIRLTGKVAFVTGGASGIPLASARALAAAGARVVIADIDAVAGQLAASAIEQAGGEGLFVETDATIESQVASAVAAAVNAFGRLDLAVNGVGRGEQGQTIVTTTSERWDWIMAMSLKSTFLAMKHEIPAMAASGGGAIINIASVAGLTTQTTSPAYAAAKAGVIHLTRYAARAHAAQGIRINSVSPGLTTSPVVEQLFTPEQIAEIAAQNQFIARASTPQEVGATVAFLCSSGAATITGVDIPVSGGIE